MPELRHDPIAGRWIIIATERARRPSDFVMEEEASTGKDCPFCVGNEEKTPPEVLAYRESGSLPNGPGWRIRVVSNKYPALKREGEPRLERIGRYERMDGVGAHEVIIESPEHRSSFHTLSRDHVTDILRVFRDRIVTLARDERLCYVVLFKNRGRVAGASLEHDHSQLIALPVMPKKVRGEIETARSYYEREGRCIFCDIVSDEISAGTRVVAQNSSFLAVAPYASRFPFEMWILPTYHSSHYESDDDEKLTQLAEILAIAEGRMDGVLKRPPYNMFLHNSPLRSEENPYYHWHLELTPRLSKVAGFEWGSGFYINTVPPEDAARYLRGNQGRI